MVPETRELSVAAGLSVVLSSRLTVHLVEACSWLTDHASHQVDVVDLVQREDYRSFVSFLPTIERG